MNEEYSRKVIPFLEEGYFQDKAERVVFTAIKDFFNSYNGVPTSDVLNISLSERKI